MGRTKTDGGAAKRPPGARGSLLVLVTLVLCLPVVHLVLAGQVGVTSAAERSAVAVIIAWAAIGGMGHLIDTYRRRNAVAAELRQAARRP